MKTTYNLIVLLVTLVLCNNGYSQNEKVKAVKYTIIAEGSNAPMPDLQIVCHNMSFNKQYLPDNFIKTYRLDRGSLYRNKMLIEIFHTEKEKYGFDKLELTKITEDAHAIKIEYKSVNSNKENDDKIVTPFLIVQVPKSKKPVKFFLDGIEVGKPPTIIKN